MSSPANLPCRLEQLRRIVDPFDLIIIAGASSSSVSSFVSFLFFFFFRYLCSNPLSWGTTLICPRISQRGSVRRSRPSHVSRFFAVSCRNAFLYAPFTAPRPCKFLPNFAAHHGHRSKSSRCQYFFFFYGYIACCPPHNLPLLTSFPSTKTIRPSLIEVVFPFLLCDGSFTRISDPSPFR